MCDKKQRWYQHLICLDIVSYILIYFSKCFIYIVYDFDENYNEINQKRQMQKLTKGSMMTYITNRFSVKRPSIVRVSRSDYQTFSSVMLLFGGASMALLAVGAICPGMVVGLLCPMFFPCHHQLHANLNPFMELYSML